MHGVALRMKLLLIDTCGAEGSFALAETSQPEIVHLRTMPGRSASERLVVELRLALGAAEWKVADAEAIAVVTGPGSFTGVRVGLSIAKGLSEATGASLVAISRLELLASVATQAAEPHPHSVCALLDAGRGEFYCGRYLDGEPLGEALLSLDAALAAVGESDLVVLCEDGVERAFAGIPSAMRIAEPNAADALPIALQHFEKGEIADSATLDANYLRRTDAEIFSSPPR
jgi:tRNA threonylcarbamoyladenosine biosynthesis protein TsaB